MTDFIKTSASRSLENAVQEHFIPAEAPWSGIVRKGQTIRIEDSYGQQAIDTLFYRADDFAERYSNQDTMRAQGGAYIGTGTKIISNEGNVMLVMTADSCGRHDTSAGACSCESNTVRFGHGTKYLHGVRYFADRGAGSGRRDGGFQQVALAALCDLYQGRQRLAHGSAIAAPLRFLDTSDLRFAHRAVVDLQNFDRLLGVEPVAIDADDDLVALVDGRLAARGRFLDQPFREAFRYGLGHDNPLS